jgi:hypothetical protein
LAHGAEPTRSQFIPQDCIVDRLQSSRAEGGVDAKGSIDNLLGDGVLVHGGLL